MHMIATILLYRRKDYAMENFCVEKALSYQHKYFMERVKNIPQRFDSR